MVNIAKTSFTIVIIKQTEEERLISDITRHVQQLSNNQCEEKITSEKITDTK